MRGIRKDGDQQKLVQPKEKAARDYLIIISLHSMIELQELLQTRISTHSQSGPSESNLIGGVKMYAYNHAAGTHESSSSPSAVTLNYALQRI